MNHFENQQPHGTKANKASNENLSYKHPISKPNNQNVSTASTFSLSSILDKSSETPRSGNFHKQFPNIAPENLEVTSNRLAVNKMHRSTPAVFPSTSILGKRKSPETFRIDTRIIKNVAPGKGNEQSLPSYVETIRKPVETSRNGGNIHEKLLPSAGKHLNKAPESSEVASNQLTANKVHRPTSTSLTSTQDKHKSAETYRNDTKITKNAALGKEKEQRLPNNATKMAKPQPKPFKLPRNGEKTTTNFTRDNESRLPSYVETFAKPPETPGNGEHTMTAKLPEILEMSSNRSASGNFLDTVFTDMFNPSGYTVPFTPRGHESGSFLSHEMGTYNQSTIPNNDKNSLGNVSMSTATTSALAQENVKNSAQDDSGVYHSDSDDVIFVSEKREKSKNTDKKCFADAPISKTCKICSKEYDRIVWHYVVNHENEEVYCARLEKNMAKMARKEKPIMEFVSCSKIKGYCLFCRRYHSSKTFEGWLMHYIKFTGEWYRCANRRCKKMVRQRTCCKQTCNDPSNLNTILSSETRSISAFLCTHCNYIQLNESNVVKHLVNQHGINEVRAHIYYTSFFLIRSMINAPEANAPEANAPEANAPEANAPEANAPSSKYSFRERKTCPNYAEYDLQTELPQENGKVNASGNQSTTSKQAIEDHIRKQTLSSTSVQQLLLSNAGQQATSVLPVTQASSSLQRNSSVRRFPVSCTQTSNSQSAQSFTSGQSLPENTTKKTQENVQYAENEYNFHSNGNTSSNTSMQQWNMGESQQQQLENFDLPIASELCEVNLHEEVTQTSNSTPENVQIPAFVQRFQDSCTQTANSQSSVSGQSVQKTISHSENRQRNSHSIEIERNPLQNNEIAARQQQHFAPNSERMPTFRENNEEVHITHIKTEPIDEEQNTLIPYITQYTKPPPDQNDWTKVKPWIKGNLSAKAKLRWDTQLALHKCMHLTCIFSTNDASKMREHIASHLKMTESTIALKLLTKEKRKMLAGYSECAYCDDDNVHSTIVNHTIKNHSNSIFQCTNCFYRTIELANLISHNERFHKDSVSRQILVCSGERVIDENEMDDVNNEFEGMCEFFKLFLSCGQCDYMCFSIDDLYNHLKADHTNQSYFCGDCGERVEAKGTEIDTHFKEHENIFEFHCIYCKKNHYGTNVVQLMREHLADHHPNRFLFAASRRIKQKFDEWISAIVDLSEYFPNNIFDSYDICKFPDTFDLNQMDPNLSAIAENRNLEKSTVEDYIKIDFESIPKTVLRPVPIQKMAMAYKDYLKQRVDQFLTNDEEEQDIKPVIHLEI